MHETIMDNFSNLAKLIVTDGRTLMMAEDLNIIYFSAIGLILVFLTLRIAAKRNFSGAGSALANDGASSRFFERQRIPALKKCPNCTEQLPLSALICEACDYNFLSRMVGRGQKFLPSPEPMTHEVPNQSFASAGL
jgi:hypothetical protein